MSDSTKRYELNDGMLEDVVGGTLKCDVTPNGATVYQYDEDHNVIGTYSVTSGHAADVYKALQSTYWSFEPGKRDEQCLDYFRSEGWI